MTCRDPSELRKADMALRLKKSIQTNKGEGRGARLLDVPVFYKLDLEAHKADPSVRARLRRVEERIDARSS